MGPKKDKADKPTTPPPTLQDVLDTINNNHTQLTNDIAGMKLSIGKIEKTSKDNSSKIKTLEKRSKKQEFSQEALEQHGRMNSIRLINGKPLPKGASSDAHVCRIINEFLIDQIDVPLNVDDIDISHPLGKVKDGKQNFIIKFVRRSRRNFILSQKKHFAEKHSGISNPSKTFITEDLTSTRREMLKKLVELKKEEKIHSCWVFSGNIFVKIDEEGDRHMLDVFFDLDRLTDYVNDL